MSDTYYNRLPGDTVKLSTTYHPTFNFEFLDTVLDIPAYSDPITMGLITKTLVDMEFWQKSFNKGLEYFESLESHDYRFEDKLREQIINAINSYPEVELNGRS